MVAHNLSLAAKPCKGEKMPNETALRRRRSRKNAGRGGKWKVILWSKYCERRRENEKRATHGSWRYWEKKCWRDQ